MITTAGWAGAALVLAVYALSATGRARASSPWCLVANLAGAAGLVAHGAAAGAWPSAVLNLGWGGAALLGLARLARGGAAAAARRPAKNPRHSEREEVPGDARGAL